MINKPISSEIPVFENKKNLKILLLTAKKKLIAISEK